MAFDLATLSVVGSPKVVLTGLEIDPWIGFPQAGVSRAGGIAYIPGASTRASRRLRQVKGDGTLHDLGLPPRLYRNIAAAADGRFAVTIREGQRSDVWIADPERGDLRRLTFEGFNIEPVWSPDASRIAYASSGEGASGQGAALGIRVRAVDGGGEQRRLVAGLLHRFPVAWTPDGRAIAYCELHPQRGADLWLLPLAEGAEPEPLRVTAAQELEADFSPDGRFLAFTSNEASTFDVYVEDLSSGARWQVSKGAGSRPRWSPDGRRLYFQGRQGLEVVDVTADGEPRFSTSRPILDGPRFLRHAVGSGGLVVVEEEEIQRAREIRVVVDWLSEWGDQEF